jgi:hypothetical protein
VSTTTAVPIPLILPVIRENNALQLILPSDYTSVDEIPVPLNTSITIRHVLARIVAVHVFYGHASRPTYTKCINKLRTALVADHLLDEPQPVPASGEGSAVGALGEAKDSDVVPAPAVSGETSTADPAAVTAPAVPSAGTARAPTATLPEVHWSLARYHPHFTFPAFRRNEVWIDLDASHPAVADRVQQYHFKRNQLATEKAREAGAEGVAAVAMAKGEAAALT